MGLEKVAPEWSGESVASPPIFVNPEILTRRKALVLVS
jgi:hypothetical protein